MCKSPDGDTKKYITINNLTNNNVVLPFPDRYGVFVIVNITL
jgi:hypothetical protein